MRCADRVELPDLLMGAAALRCGGPLHDVWVQCDLSAHSQGDHFGLIDSLEYGRALWAKWASEELELVELADCDETQPPPAHEGCCLFSDHAGRHSWEPSEYPSDGRPALRLVP